VTGTSFVDLFVAKYSGSDGRHLWSRHVEGTGISNTAYGIAVDSSGNVLVTGVFTGTADFGGGPLTSAGGDDIFIAKYAGNNGGHLWSRRFGSTGQDRGYAVGVDAADDIIVTGYFGGSVDFGGGPLASAGGTDVFLAKYAAAGAHLWTKRLGGSSGDTPTGLAIDDSGTMVLTGYFQGTANFGGGSLASAGGTDVFLAKYSAAGAHLWSKRLGGTTDDHSSAVAVDGAGNVVVTGYFTGTADFGGGPLTSAGGTDIFLAKYSAAGTHLWSQRFGSSSTYGDVDNGLAVDSTGNVVLTGAILGSVTFGGPTLVMTNNYDIFVAKFSGDGTHLWSKRPAGSSTGGPGHDHGIAVTTDVNDNVVVTGDFVQAVDFGGGTLTSTGGADGFLVKFEP
jgi:hypothetical protein